MTDQSIKLTDSDITALIDSYGFHLQGTLTICIITLKNGATVTGESRPISDANYNLERGQEAAYRKAREKIWELEGYALRRDAHKLLELMKLSEQDAAKGLVMTKNDLLDQL